MSQHKADCRYAALRYDPTFETAKREPTNTCRRHRLFPSTGIFLLPSRSTRVIMTKYYQSLHLLSVTEHLLAVKQKCGRYLFQRGSFFGTTSDATHMHVRAGHTINNTCWPWFGNMTDLFHWAPVNRTSPSSPLCVSGLFAGLMAGPFPYLSG